MTRRHLAALAALTALALGVSACGSDDGATGTTETTTETGATGTGTTLEGTVGPGFTITLTENGQDVSTLTAGTYTLNMNDMSSAHNFHLTGPGVDEATDVSSEGTKTVEVVLEAGTYTFVCDPHSDSMNGSFEVTG